MAEQDDELQDLYAQARERGIFHTDPELASLTQQAVKRGILKDLSGGSTAPKQTASIEDTAPQDVTAGMFDPGQSARPAPLSVSSNPSARPAPLTPTLLTDNSNAAILNAAKNALAAYPVSKSGPRPALSARDLTGYVPGQTNSGYSPSQASSILAHILRTAPTNAPDVSTPSLMSDGAPSDMSGVGAILAHAKAALLPTTPPVNAPVSPPAPPAPPSPTPTASSSFTPAGGIPAGGFLASVRQGFKDVGDSLSEVGGGVKDIAEGAAEAVSGAAQVPVASIYNAGGSILENVGQSQLANAARAHAQSIITRDPSVWRNPQNAAIAAAAGAGGRAYGAGVVPAGAGIVGFNAAAVPATAGVMAGTGNPLLAGGAGIVAGALGAAGAGGLAAGAQDKLTHAMLGDDLYDTYMKQRAADATDQPVATAVGGALPMGLFQGVSRNIGQAVGGALFGGGLDAGTQAVEQLAKDHKLDPSKFDISRFLYSAGTGAAFGGHETTLGEPLGNAGKALGNAVTPRGVRIRAAIADQFSGQPEYGITRNNSQARNQSQFDDNPASSTSDVPTPGDSFVATVPQPGDVHYLPETGQRVRVLARVQGTNGVPMVRVAINGIDGSERVRVIAESGLARLPKESNNPTNQADGADPQGQSTQDNVQSPSSAIQTAKNANTGFTEADTDTPDASYTGIKDFGTLYAAIKNAAPQLTSEQARQSAIIGESVARGFAADQGISTADWYRKNLAGITRVGEITAQTFADDYNRNNGLKAENAVEGDDFNGTTASANKESFKNTGIMTRDDARQVISLFPTADSSTFLHELAHVFRRQMNAEDLAPVEAWSGVKGGKWTPDAEERFANGYENYLKKGEAPNPSLTSAFARFKTWITLVHSAIMDMIARKQISRSVFSPAIESLMSRYHGDVSDITGEGMKDAGNVNQHAGVLPTDGATGQGDSGGSAGAGGGNRGAAGNASRIDDEREAAGESAKPVENDTVQVGDHQAATANAPSGEKRRDSSPYEIEQEDAPAPHATSYREVAPEDLKVLPGFQFKKELTDTKNGVTDQLKGQTDYDTFDGGMLTAWESKDGTLYVGDGHHRRELGMRAGRFVEPQADGSVKEVPRKLRVQVLREADGWTQDGARQWGVLKNMKEGKGRAIDAADALMRSGDDPRVRTDARESVKRLPETALKRDTGGLIELSSALRRSVENKEVDEPVAAGIGRALAGDAERQSSAMDAARRNGRLHTYADGVSLGQEVKSEELVPTDPGQSGMDFDDVDVAKSRTTAAERAEIKQALIAKVNAERRGAKSGLDVDLLPGENIDVDARKRLASAIGESKNDVNTKLHAAFEYDGDLRDGIKDAARRLALGEITKSQAVESLHPRLMESARRPIADIVKGNSTGVTAAKNDGETNTQDASVKQEPDSSAARPDAAPVSAVAQSDEGASLFDDKSPVDPNTPILDQVADHSEKVSAKPDANAPEPTVDPNTPILDQVAAHADATPVQQKPVLEKPVPISEVGDPQPIEKTTPKEADTVDSRIVTARPSETLPADTSFLPASLLKHLYKHQAQGVASAIRAMDGKDSAFLLADGTGVGKTREMFAIAKYYADKGMKVLIVAPNEVLGKPFANKGIVTGSYDKDSRAMGIQAELRKDGMLGVGDIVMTTYHHVDKYTGAVDKNTVVLFDESHALKNDDGARASAGIDIAGKAGKVLFASATPADKVEHLTYLQRAGALEGMSQGEQFARLGLHLRKVGSGKTQKYVWAIDPEVGREQVFQNIADLFGRMTGRGQMIKRELSLDGVNFLFRTIKLSDEEKQHIDNIEDFIGGGSVGDDGEARGVNPLKKAQYLQHQRRQQETFKVPSVVDSVMDSLKNGERPIVFASRVNESAVTRKVGEGDDAPREELMRSDGTMKLLREELIKRGVDPSLIAEIHGGTKAKPGDEADRFQRGEAKIVLATIESGGTGINLDDTTGDAPRRVIMMTAPFSAVQNMQAIGRAWRATSKSKPVIEYVFADTPTDAWNTSIIGSKMKMLGATVAGEAGRLDIPNPDMYGLSDMLPDRAGQSIASMSTGKADASAGADKWTMEGAASESHAYGATREIKTRSTGKTKYLLPLPSGMTRAQISTQTAAAKIAGGYFTGAYDGNPAGFAFNTKFGAEVFRNSQSGSRAVPALDKSAPILDQVAAHSENLQTPRLSENASAIPDTTQTVADAADERLRAIGKPLTEANNTLMQSAIQAGRDRIARADADWRGYRLDDYNPATGDAKIISTRQDADGNHPVYNVNVLTGYGDSPDNLTHLDGRAGTNAGGRLLKVDGINTRLRDAGMGSVQVVAKHVEIARRLIGASGEAVPDMPSDVLFQKRGKADTDTLDMFGGAGSDGEEATRTQKERLANPGGNDAWRQRDLFGDQGVQGAARGGMGKGAGGKGSLNFDQSSLGGMFDETPKAAPSPLDKPTGSDFLDTLFQKRGKAGASDERTATPEFKRWFGDWEGDPKNASKVVDKDGKPLVVYHGTYGNFTEFDPDKSAEAGFHFGTSDQADARIRKTNQDNLGRESSVKPVYLSLRNPVVLDSDPGNFGSIAKWDTHFEDVLHAAGVKGSFTGKSKGEVVSALKSQGYDGFAYPNRSEGRGMSYGVFDSSQIKSATGNSGEFDPSNLDIRYQKRGKGVDLDRDYNERITEMGNPDYKPPTYEPGTKGYSRKDNGNPQTFTANENGRMVRDAYDGRRVGVDNNTYLQDRDVEGEPDISRGKKALLSRISLEKRVKGLDPEIADAASDFVNMLPEKYLGKLGSSFHNTTGFAIKGKAALGFYDPTDGVISIARMGVNGSDFGERVIPHEISHSLQSFVPEGDMKALQRQYGYEKSAKEDGLKKQSASLLDQSEKAADPGERARLRAESGRLSQQGYRYKDFGEWFAENIADRGLRDIFPPEASEKKLYQRVVNNLRGVLATFHDFLIRRGFPDKAESVYRNLLSGKYGADARRGVDAARSAFEDTTNRDGDITPDDSTHPDDEGDVLFQKRGKADTDTLDMFGGAGSDGEEATRTQKERLANPGGNDAWRQRDLFGDQGVQGAARGGMGKGAGGKGSLNFDQSSLGGMFDETPKSAPSPLDKPTGSDFLDTLFQKRGKSVPSDFPAELKSRGVEPHTEEAENWYESQYPLTRDGVTNMENLARHNDRPSWAVRTPGFHPETNRIADIASSIPEQYRQFAGRVYELNEQREKTLSGRNPAKNNGTFSLQGIGISQKLLDTNPEKATITLAHEIGHSLWKHLPETLKARWGGVSGADLRKNDVISYYGVTPTAELPPTSYAHESPQEDFAESFAMHLVGGSNSPFDTRTNWQNGQRQLFFRAVDEWVSGGRTRPIQENEPPFRIDGQGMLFQKRSKGNAGDERTATPEFKRWFGDWEGDPKNASKVVDADGKPLVVYHGTPSTSNFTRFSDEAMETGENAHGAGHYFSDHPEIANMYTSGKGDGGVIYPVHLNIKKPIDADSTRRNITKAQIKKLIESAPIEQQEDGLSNYGDVNYNGRGNVIRAAVDSLDRYANDDLQLIYSLGREFYGKDWASFYPNVKRVTGFDGVIKHMEGDSDNDIRPFKNYVAFDPAQIKSATGNSGEFDPSNPDINYQMNRKKRPASTQSVNAAPAPPQSAQAGATVTRAIRSPNTTPNTTPNPAPKPDKTFGQKAKDMALDVIGLPHSLTFSYDLGAPFRQGSMFSMSEMAVTRKAWGNMIASIGSQKAYDAFAQTITDHPDRAFAERSGLYLASMKARDPNLSTHEEGYMSRIAQKIPGVHASERGYVAFLDRQRMDVFSKFAKELGAAGLDRDKDASVYARAAKFVNAATGRGELPKILSDGDWPRVLAAVFSSPRLMASRMEILTTPAQLPGMHPALRKAVAKRYAAYIGGLSLSAGLVIAAGGTVSTNPDDPDFMKAKFGNTRYDLTGGNAQYVRAGFRLLRGFKNNVTESGNRRGQEPSDVALSFLRGKLSPAASLLNDYSTGKTFSGGKPGALPHTDAKTGESNTGELVQHFTPLAAQDLYEAYKEEGLFGMAKQLPALVGVSTRTYKGGDFEKKELRAEAAEERTKLRDAVIPADVTRMRYEARRKQMDAIPADVLRERIRALQDARARIESSPRR